MPSVLLFRRIIFILFHEEGQAMPTPRSALRYRPILGTLPTDIRPVLPRASRMRSSSAPSTDVQEPSGPGGDEDIDLEESVAKPPSHRMAKPPRAGRSPVSYQRRWRLHPLFFLGGGLLVMLLLLVLVTQAITWGTNALNTLRYGLHVSSDDRLDQFSPRREVVIL